MWIHKRVLSSFPLEPREEHPLKLFAIYVMLGGVASLAVAIIVQRIKELLP